jgi:polyferredoxin
MNKPITPKKFATDLWDMMQMAIDEAVAAEREECAKVCDRANLRFHLLWGKFEYPEDQAMSIGASQCAAAIRERGQA